MFFILLLFLLLKNAFDWHMGRAKYEKRKRLKSTPRIAFAFELCHQIPLMLFSMCNFLPQLQSAGRKCVRVLLANGRKTLLQSFLLYQRALNAVHDDVHHLK